MMCAALGVAEDSPEVGLVQGLAGEGARPGSGTEERTWCDGFEVDVVGYGKPINS